jgi:hypothetical protein
MEVLAHKPIGLEGMAKYLVEDMKKKDLHPKNIQLLPEGQGWLLCEFGGDTREKADRKAKDLLEELSHKDNPPFMKLLDDPWQERQIWIVRRSGLGATARARRTRYLGGLGRFFGAAGKARRLPARPAQAF